MEATPALKWCDYSERAVLREEEVLGSSPVLDTGESRGFKSHLPDDNIYPSVAQFGSAPALGAGGQEFESLHSDHNSPRSCCPE